MWQRATFDATAAIAAAAVVVLLFIPGSSPPWYHCHRDESNGDEREVRREPGRVGVSMRRMVLLLVLLSVITA